MAIPVIKSDLERRIGVAQVATFSRGSSNVANDANVVAAVAQAWDRARSAALNTFSAASWDALTAETLPPEALYHIVSDAIGILSAGHKPDEQIVKNAEEAARWRSWLASGKVRCFDDVLVTVGAGSSSVRHRRSSPERVFDRSNPSQAFNIRDPEI